ncbi:hypothetical protein TNIN_210191 [Trichonephila inaurata madagascariensis]|uniref:Uncharacterized protein n=1 Tax=Trichonephila inaurata madagascariensis TaxID=2747483 RepID=A0A8X6IQT5_9ARAC|nr:hypothetical protein TNIN_149941 [Trichonephila inaurata madagascariensis]GFY61224.1 hypothetical protein TNIN_210191 [Trichonephila inaurata madagascariensis]
MRSHIQDDLSAGNLQTSCSRLEMVKFLKILQQASSLCYVVKLSTLLTNFCPRCILTFSKTSRIETGFLPEQFCQTEMMWLRSLMSPFRSSFQGKNVPTSL